MFLTLSLTGFTNKPHFTPAAMDKQFIGSNVDNHGAKIDRTDVVGNDDEI